MEEVDHGEDSSEAVTPRSQRMAGKSQRRSSSHMSPRSHVSLVWDNEADITENTRTLRRAIANDLEENKVLKSFQSSLSNWRAGDDHSETRLASFSTRRRPLDKGKTPAPSPPPGTTEDEDVDSEHKEYDPDCHTNVYFVQYKISDGTATGKSKLRPRYEPGAFEDAEGKFPNQRSTISRLFESTEGSSEFDRRWRRHSEDDIRGLLWIHFPANNMDWIEAIIAKYYGEPRGNDSHARIQRQALLSRSQMLLRPQFWRNQQSGGTETDPQGKHMRPLCELVEAGPSMSDQPNCVIFMPYIHWELSTQSRYFSHVIYRESLKEARKLRNEDVADTDARIRLRETVPMMDDHRADVGRKAAPNLRLEDIYTPEQMPADAFDPFDGRFIKILGNLSGRAIKPVSRRPGRLGQLLLDAAKLHRAMSNFRDKKMHQKYLFNKPPLHPRRSLDAADYWARSTPGRQTAQVVYQATTATAASFHQLDRETGQWPRWCQTKGGCNSCRTAIRKVSRVLMVDQLWMWILDGDTIITAFPQRYGLQDDDEDLSGVHRVIRNRLALPTTHINSIVDLAEVITDECCNSFFNPSNIFPVQPQALKIFSDSVAVISNKRRLAMKHFRFWSQVYTKAYKAVASSLSGNVSVGVNVSNEINLMCEVQDTLDEIEILSSVFRTQAELLLRFAYIRSTLLLYQGGHRLGGHVTDDDDDFMSSETRTRRRPGRSAAKPRDTLRGEVDESSEQSDSYRNSSDHLADPFPSAKPGTSRTEATQRAVDSRLRSLLAIRDGAVRINEGLAYLLDLKDKHMQSLQALAASTQTAETISVFTIVSTVFLPLSFMTSVFGMNAKELDISMDGRWVEMPEQFKLVFGVSIGVTFVVLLFAFNIYVNTAVRILLNFVVIKPLFWIMIQLFGEDWWIKLRTFGMTNSDLGLEKWKAEVANSKRLRGMKRRARSGNDGRWTMMPWNGEDTDGRESLMTGADIEAPSRGVGRLGRRSKKSKVESFSV